MICRGGYESGERPFGRNIILNDDIGGARGGARNRASLPRTHVARAEMKIVESRAARGVRKTCAAAQLCPRFPLAFPLRRHLCNRDLFDGSLSGRGWKKKRANEIFALCSRFENDFVLKI